MPPKKRGRAKAPAIVDTVHEWTRTYTYTDSEGSCECEAKFTTTVTSLVLLGPSADLVESSDDFGSDSESDC